MTRDMERSIKKLRVTAQALEDCKIRGDEFARANNLVSNLRMLARNLEANGEFNIAAAEALIEKHSAKEPM